MRKLFIAFFLLAAVVAPAQPRLAGPSDKGSFRLSGSTIMVDPEDYAVVTTAAGLFSDDVAKVCGTALRISDKAVSGTAVIAGTLGHSSFIDDMVKRGRIDASPVQGKWECFQIEIVKNPVKGVSNAIVIVGSDRRGTAYGILSLSRAIGVSPWYWWLDITPRKCSRPAIALDGKFVSREPSVKYRAIFTNDEDWGLRPWSAKTIDKEYGNIACNTHEKKCELLLRLYANTLEPANHKGTIAFNQIPENRVIADRYGILMTGSTAEPLLINCPNEWNEKKFGKWDYTINRERIDSIFNDRLSTNGRYENIYPVGIRGIADTRIQGGDDFAAKIRIIEDAIASERAIIEKHTGKPASEVPQSYTPYKELLSLYENGLELPDDVTLVWPDDNYGYIKRISNAEEQKRSGRSGVYYHVSYLGKPHEYLWMCSTPPVLMYKELSKLYRTGGDRIWIVNVGDLKGCESAMNLFLAMAYDLDSFNYDNVWKYNSEWLASIFGQEYYEDLLDINTSFLDLAFQHKPEFMGWGYDWNIERKEICTDTEYSWLSYDEASRRLAEYFRLSAKVSRMYARIPESLKTVFHHTVYYPVTGAYLMNRMHLLAQKCREYSQTGRAAASAIKAQVKECYDSLQLITSDYCAMTDGKWDGIVRMEQCKISSYFELPVLEVPPFDGKKTWGITVEDGGAAGFNILPQFSRLTGRPHWFEVYSRDGSQVKVERKYCPEWVVTETVRDEFGDVRINVNVDWTKVPAGPVVKGEIVLGINGDMETVLVSAANPGDVPQDVKFVEDGGVVSIDAASFSRNVVRNGVEVKLLDNFGFEGQSVMLGVDLEAPQSVSPKKSTTVEYDFWCTDRGMVDVYTYVLPCFESENSVPVHEHEVQQSETRFGVTIDNGAVLWPSFNSVEYEYDWYISVLRNCRILKTPMYIDKPGKHTVKITCGTQGLVLQKIVIDFGGLKRSYTGPQPTVRENSL